MTLSNFKIRTTAYATVILLAIVPALAGDLELEWNPSDGADGYNMYRGLAPGSYGGPTDVGNVTTTVVDGLADCTTHYFSVTAYNAAGESTYSNETSSWPRPRIATVSPSSAEQDRSLDLVLSGMNFQNGATVAFSDPGIVVNSMTVNACSELVVGVTIGSGSTPGPVDVTVTLASGAKGTGAGVFQVEQAVAPDVASTFPVDGAIDVSVAVRPTATFTEPVDPTSVSSSTVRLLDDNDVAVAQAAGSPALDPDGTVATITPQDDLVEGRTYRIQVVGGAGGVLDLAGHSMTSTYLQTTGFSTVADKTPPTISAVQTTNVGSTSATVTWTTDEASDGRVRYRVAGTVDYQASPLSTDLVLDHSVTLEGLAPDTTYEYHVESTDAAGNTAQSSPDQTFTTTSSAYGYLRFESEAGDRTGAMIVGSGAGAFQGEWVEATAQGNATNPSGTATFGVHVPTTGTWFLWVRMYASDLASASMFESVDGAARRGVQPDVAGTWTWVAGRQYDLTAGLHEVELAGRNIGARADRVLLTDDPSFVPTEGPIGDNTAPAPVASFLAAPAVESVNLSWTTPADADFDRTVVRYRTDGRFPVSPADGFAVIEMSGAPSADQSHVHSGLQAGVTYSYAAFAIDANGNVSDVATAEATPDSALQPPAAPTGLRVANN